MTLDATPDNDDLPAAFPTTHLPLTEADKNRRAVLNRYTDGGLIVVQAAANLTPEQAAARPGPGAWSLAELFAHLADCDLVLADRMKRVIAEEDPTLPAFSENDWIDRLGSAGMPVSDAAALFAANRLWVGRLLRGLDESAFRRAGLHTEMGRVTLAQIMVRSIHHLDHRLRFLYAKRARLGVSIYPRYASNPGF